MGETPNTEREVVTLERLIYDVRDIVGAAKDDFLLGIGSADPPRVITSWQVSNFCPKVQSAEYYAKITRAIGEILKDPLLNQEDPLATRVENASRQNTYLEKAGNVLKAALPLSNGTITPSGFVVLSKTAKELYEALEPIAKESRFYDHKTGLRISDWLMNNLFEYLKEYITDPTRNISLVNIDLNNFSQSNGLVGKEQTDIVVAQFARVLKELPDGVAVRRTGERGDEFYICFRTDAEGAQAILQHKFVKPLEQRLMDYVKDACNRELPGGYSSAFEDAGFSYTCAIGVTSTYIPGGQSIFQRAVNALNGGGEKEALKQELAMLDGLEPDGRTRKYRRETNDVKKGILNILKQVLEDESEKAMKAAKNQDHNANVIFVYDPVKKKETYVYKKA